MSYSSVHTLNLVPQAAIKNPLFCSAKIMKKKGIDFINSYIIIIITLKNKVDL